jgi:hypothetical protein
MSSPKSVNRPAVKKAYRTPRVAKYGKLKDLTTGGTGNANEPSSGKKPRP